MELRRLGAAALVWVALVAPAFAQVTVVNSGSTTTVTEANTIAVTKPSGLAVGDLMIAHVYARNNTSSLWDVVASGFTLVHSIIVPNISMGVWWKIADAGDVAASTFTFGWNGQAVNGLGRIWRISRALIHDHDQRVQLQQLWRPHRYRTRHHAPGQFHDPAAVQRGG